MCLGRGEGAEGAGGQGDDDPPETPEPTLEEREGPEAQRQFSTGPVNIREGAIVYIDALRFARFPQQQNQPCVNHTFRPTSAVSNASKIANTDCLLKFTYNAPVRIGVEAQGYSFEYQISLVTDNTSRGNITFTAPPTQNVAAGQKITFNATTYLQEATSAYSCLLYTSPSPRD